MGGQFLDLWGGHSCYERDIELMGGLSPVPPTRETLAPIQVDLTLNFKNRNESHIFL